LPKIFYIITFGRFLDELGPFIDELGPFIDELGRFLEDSGAIHQTIWGVWSFYL